MGLSGYVSRVDCDITPGSQALSARIYQLVCGHDGRDAEGDYSRGASFAAQRKAEIDIINEKLMTDPPYVGWDYTSFSEDSLVILDCPRANGGICVINTWNDRYIHITSFRPTRPGSRDEIIIQTGYFLEHQGTAAVAHGEPREEVSEAVALIRQSRYVFDHPEMGQTMRDAISQGANILLDLIRP